MKNKIIVLIAALIFTYSIGNCFEEVRCIQTIPGTTVCRNNKGEIVKTIVDNNDGTFTLTTKEGTKRCFLLNNVVVCR